MDDKTRPTSEPATRRRDVFQAAIQALEDVKSRYCVAYTATGVAYQAGTDSRTVLDELIAMLRLELRDIRRGR